MAAWLAIPSLILCGLGVLSAVGIAVFALGWRGRRVNDHPICRRCAFDLVGLGGAGRCPECGADILRPRAVRIGARAKRRWALSLGAFLLLTSLTMLGAAKWMQTSGFNWNAIEPTWLLVLEVKHARRDPIGELSELAKRSMEGRLSTSTVRQLLPLALDAQANTGRAWIPEWGSLVESARSTGRCPDDIWTRYCQQGWRFHTTTYRRAHTQEWLPFCLIFDDADMRLGRGTFGEIHAELDNFEVNTQARRLDNANWAWKFQSQGGRLIMTRHTGWIESAPGLLKARIRWSVTGSFGSNASAPLNCEWTVEETLQSEIVETGVPLVELVFDPAVEEQLKHGMSATVIQTQQDCDVRITFDGNSLTTAVVGDLLLLERLSDGEYGPPREWTFGQYILERNTQTEPRIKEFSWGGMTVDTAVVDVVIRPAPTFACWETLYNSIWGKQITIPGVRVIRKPEGQSNESDGEPDGSKPMPAKD